MSFFEKLFKFSFPWAYPETSDIDRLISSVESGLSNLKTDYREAREALNQVRTQKMTAENRIGKEKRMADEYERQAMVYLKQGQKGQLDAAKADQFALEALSMKNRHTEEAEKMLQELELHERSAHRLESAVSKLRSSIISYENELQTLKSRAQTARSTKKINEKLVGMDDRETLNLLKQMKERIEEEEALAQAYEEITAAEIPVDVRIDRALGMETSGGAPPDRLENLKKQLGITDK